MKVLFVPVSAPRGYGEYARACEIAGAVQRRWPQAQVQLVLSVQAPYAAHCPFPATLLPGSATLHTAQVVQLLNAWRPDLVIFDNAGRTAQLRAARAIGARVVYISSRRRQRAKAFRLSWMRILDEHWIAYPRLIAGDLGWLERLKVAALGRPRIDFIDTLLPLADPTVADSLPPSFVLVVPGGGSAHPGARSAPQIVADAALQLARRGLATVLVGVDAPGEECALLRRLPLLPAGQLLELMRRAVILVSNGGDTLLQGLALGCACVAVPIAHDQAARIARCRDLGLLQEAALESAAIVAAVVRLHADEARRAALSARARAADIRDARPQILARIAALTRQAAP